MKISIHVEFVCANLTKTMPSHGVNRESDFKNGFRDRGRLFYVYRSHAPAALSETTVCENRPPGPYELAKAGEFPDLSTVARSAAPIDVVAR